MTGQHVSATNRKTRLRRQINRRAIQEKKGSDMHVTTKAVRALDADKLQALIDEGFTFVTTRFNQAISEIVVVRGSTVDVQFPETAYATPVRIDTITAVHKPELDDDEEAA